jgi:hypothetical protein
MIQERDQFVKIPHTLLEDERCENEHVSSYLAIAYHDWGPDHGDRCTASLRTLSEKARISTGALKSAIADLVAWGYVHSEERFHPVHGGQETSVRWILDPGHSAATPPATTLPPPSHAVAAPRPPSHTPSGHPVAAKKTKQNRRNEIDETEAAARGREPAATPIRKADEGNDGDPKIAALKAEGIDGAKLREIAANRSIYEIEAAIEIYRRKGSSSGPGLIVHLLGFGKVASIDREVVKRADELAAKSDRDSKYLETGMIWTAAAITSHASNDDPPF